MANQNFNLTGVLQIREAKATDAETLHVYCLTEKTKKQVTDELKADLAEGSNVYRLVAEASGYAIGQIKVKQHPTDKKIGQIGELAVSGPFRQLGVADHLIKAAEATSAENGIKTLEIEIASSEGPVVQRYKDWGFTEKPTVVLQKTIGADEAPAEESPETEIDAATDGEQQELLGT